jgi:uncharacterized membrane protein
MVDYMRTFARWLLGIVLIVIGVSHLTWNRAEFVAQVPTWVPVGTDLVVLASGVVEITLGALLVTATKYRIVNGRVVGLFFVAIFPGNISQYLTHTDAFGLNSDVSRGIRLLFQPLLVLWALWSTSARGNQRVPRPGSE